MLYRTFKVVWAMVLLISFWPAAARAQFGGGMLAGSPAKETISATGTVSLKRQPTALRMHVELSARGKTLKEALAKLKDRREAATVQLDQLKADKKSVTFSNPSLSNIQSAQRRQFEAMVMKRMMSRGKKVPKGLKVSRLVTVSTKLSAEWPLQADGPEELLLAAEALQEKVKAADLAGTRNAEELSPEEEELAEEMAAVMGNSGEEQIRIGVPHFVYVARISQQQRDKAMAEAFAKAKAQASGLAQAAGVKLGPLVGLSGQGGGRTSYDEEVYGNFGYAQRNYLRSLMDRQAMEDEGTGNEAVGSDAGSLRFVFYVGAVFSFQK